MRAQLIVGIDPGTTSGYVALDTRGNLVAKESGKDIPFEEMLRRVTNQGIVLVVATDKAKVPDLVYRFAAKTGAKIYAPPQDILVCEKKELTAHLTLKDAHQMDAAASALSAYAAHASTLSKIQEQCRLHNALNHFNTICVAVIKNGTNITDAIRAVLTPATPHIASPKTAQERVQVSKKPAIDWSAHVRKLANALQRHKKKISFLKNKLTGAQDPVLRDKKISDALHWKEERIKELTCLVRSTTMHAHHAKDQLTFARELLLSDLVFMPRLKRLSLPELQRIVHYKGNWAWVSEGHPLPEKTVLAAKLWNVKFLVEKGRLNEELEWYPASDVKHTVFLDLVGVEKAHLEHLKNPCVIGKIIKDYKQEQQQNT
ncbi:DUF460 domain-containing protein [Candidatus Woesearchaeota archaeon]|nr:DUF460 domain-containing protein [Candidatus Woesearchaeota archaeon]